MDEPKKKKKKSDEAIKRKFEFVTREEWGAKPPKTKKIDALKMPVKNIRYSFTNTKEDNCINFETCCKELKVIQEYFQAQDYADLPYNFLISSDGQIYEGRGWYCDVERHETYRKFRRKCIDITYIREIAGGFPHMAMTEAAARLVRWGIRHNYIKELVHVETLNDFRDYLYQEDQLH